MLFSEGATVFLLSAEHIYELAMYLDLLNTSLFPKWPEIFATSEKVMERLKIGDPTLHAHLTETLQIDPQVNPKVRGDFPHNLQKICLRFKEFLIVFLRF